MTIDVECSKGTYIRSLARDIGRAAGSFGYLSELKRYSVGSFLLENAVSPENFDPEADILSSRAVFDHLTAVSTLDVTGKAVALVRNGMTPGDSFFPVPPKQDGLYALFDQEEFLGVVERSGGAYRYKMVRGV